MNKYKAGLALGSFSAVAHLVWSILVMSGLAQPLYSWFISLHAISATMTIGEMSIGGMVMLVIFGFIMGNIVGWVFASIWNWVNK